MFRDLEILMFIFENAICDVIKSNVFTNLHQLQIIIEATLYIFCPIEYKIYVDSNIYISEIYPKNVCCQSLLLEMVYILTYNYH